MTKKERRIEILRWREEWKGRKRHGCIEREREREERVMEKRS